MPRNLSGQAALTSLPGDTLPCLTAPVQPSAMQPCLARRYSRQACVSRCIGVARWLRQAVQTEARHPAVCGSVCLCSLPCRDSGARVFFSTHAQQPLGSHARRTSPTLRLAAVGLPGMAWGNMWSGLHLLAVLDV